MLLCISLCSCKRQPSGSDVLPVHEIKTLWSAAGQGDLPEVQKILGQGTLVNLKDQNGNTALYYAAQSKNASLVRFLIHQGADVNATGGGNVTPLMLSVDMAFGNPEIALELIKAGADVSAADKNGDTALLIATTESSQQVMWELLRRGPNPNARGFNGDTALHYAAMNGLSDRVKLLVRYGADPSIRNSGGRSAIDVAATTNSDSEVRKHFETTRNVLIAALPRQKK